jgi:hypothetical protein
MGVALKKYGSSFYNLLEIAFEESFPWAYVGDDLRFCFLG